jgi:hypothetical protein
MKKTTLLLRSLSAAVAVLFTTSCYYDSNVRGGGGSYDDDDYSENSYSDSGYRSGISANFVFTSNDRWLYDPIVYCYYDRHSRRYYDPYLYGYYPAGYCPRPIYGAHHPGGWRPGNRYCSPPSVFRDRYLSNHHNRVQLLRASNRYSWAASVRENNSHNDSWRNQRIRNASSFKRQRNNDDNREMRNRQIRQQPLELDDQKKWNRDRNDDGRLQNQEQQRQRQPRQAFAPSNEDGDSRRLRRGDGDGNGQRMRQQERVRPQREAPAQREIQREAPQQQRQERVRPQREARQPKIEEQANADENPNLRTGRGRGQERRDGR